MVGPLLLFLALAASAEPPGTRAIAPSARPRDQGRQIPCLLHFWPREPGGHSEASLHRREQAAVPSPNFAQTPPAHSQSVAHVTPNGFSPAAGQAGGASAAFPRQPTGPQASATSSVPTSNPRRRRFSCPDLLPFLVIGVT